MWCNVKTLTAIWTLVGHQWVTDPAALPASPLASFCFLSKGLSIKIGFNANNVSAHSWWMRPTISYPLIIKQSVAAASQLLVPRIDAKLGLPICGILPPSLKHVGVQSRVNSCLMPNVPGTGFRSDVTLSPMILLPRIFITPSHCTLPKPTTCTTTTCVSPCWGCGLHWKPFGCALHHVYHCYTTFTICFVSSALSPSTCVAYPVVICATVVLFWCWAQFLDW